MKESLLEGFAPWLHSLNRELEDYSNSRRLWGYGQGVNDDELGGPPPCGWLTATSTSEGREKEMVPLFTIISGQFVEGVEFRIYKADQAIRRSRISLDRAISYLVPVAFFNFTPCI